MGVSNALTLSTFTAPSTAQVTVSASAAQLPGMPGKLIKLSAPSSNAGTTYFGNFSVTTGTGYPIAAGTETSWLPFDNASRFYIIGTASDKVAILVAD